MSSKIKVVVNINGNEYKIISDDSKEYVYSVADYVDTRVQTFADANKKKSLSDIAILTALNIADDYFKLKSELSLAKANGVSPKINIDETRDKLKDFGEELEKRNVEYETIIQQFKRLLDNTSLYENQLGELKEKLHVLSYELEHKEQELKSSHNRIVQLEAQISEIKSTKRESITFSNDV